MLMIFRFRARPWLYRSPGRAGTLPGVDVHHRVEVLQRKFCSVVPDLRARIVHKDVDPMFHQSGVNGLPRTRGWPGLRERLPQQGRPRQLRQAKSGANGPR